MLVRMQTSSGGGSSTPSEFSGVVTSYGGVIIDTTKVTSVKFKFSNRNSGSDTLRINVSNTAYNLQDSYNYGTNVKVYSTIMSDYVDLLALSEVSGYRYICFTTDRSASATVIDFQVS